MRRTLDVLALVAAIAVIAVEAFTPTTWEAAVWFAFAVAVFALIDLADHPPPLPYDGYKRVQIPQYTPEGVYVIDWDWPTSRDIPTTTGGQHG